jgi:hypothetical protein
VSSLLYCVFRGRLPAALEISKGVGGERVFTANYNTLGAALSTLAEPESPPEISKLLVYEAVVESFYRHLTVIPMRYGCQVGCPYEAVNLLRENYDAYGALLGELEGLAEMGIKVLLDHPRAEAETDRLAIPPEWFPPRSSMSGAAYLDAKKLHYLGAQQETMAQHALVENLCDLLNGIFVRHKVEFPSSRRSCLLSLYFLVPRDSVECFRRATRGFPQNESMKLLLSGPWPPYNFVDGMQP